MASSAWRASRRALLSRLLSALSALSIGRRLPGNRSPSPTQPRQASRYLELESPVVLPLERIAEPWRALPFQARVARPEPAAGAALLEGVLLRAADDERSPRDRAAGRGVAEIRAFCVLCPHEICHVEYRTDTWRLQLDDETIPSHPLFVCPCHFSVFDPLAGGERLGGPALRGLYRFRFRASDSEVEILQVEEDVLTLL